MNLNRTILLAVLAGFPLILAACGQQQLGTPPPQAKNGSVDLQNWTGDEADLLPLTGEWAFYWQQLLTPAEVGETAVTNYVPVPSSWQNYTLAGDSLPPEGYATFHLQLQHLAVHSFCHRSASSTQPALKASFEQDDFASQHPVGAL